MTIAVASLPETLARRHGKCRLCPHPVRVNDHIVKLPQIGWSHSRCASAYRAVLDDHEDEGEDDDHDSS